MSTLQVEVPRKLAPLVQPARYIGAHGGRGGAKSHFFAEKAVLRNYERPAKGVCIREVQESIKDSVKALIEAKIQKLGLGAFFDVTRDEIRGLNGSLMIFKGMQSYNAENIKSLEGFDWAWVEEAQTLSAVSLRMLRPTIRKEGSEIWFSWNPRHDTDAVDQFLRGPNKPKDAIVVEVNWNDNPWLPDVLRQEKDADYAADPEMAEHVWGGGYEIISEGSYYGKLLAESEKAGRIGSFPASPNALTKTAWDIGVDDYTAIWFIQDDGLHATVVDYYEVSGDGADDIVAACMPEVFRPPSNDERWLGWSKENALNELGRPFPLKYGVSYLPHDIKFREWGAGARSRIESLAAYGVRNIAKGAAANPADRIQAVRRILPIVRFNNTPRVNVGLKRLRRYRRKWNDNLQTYTTPEHDENSHGCLVAGSLVRMGDGSYKPIETIKAGELVWTPSGNCAILWSGFVKMSQELIDIETTCGKRLTCTREHKILTERGFVAAGSLSPSMMIWTGHGWKAHLIGLLSKVSGIGFRALITGERPTAGTISTGLFGKQLTARYLTGITSTTRTRIRSIIHSAIWSVYRSTIISALTPKTCSSEESCRHRVNLLGSVPLSGIGPKKAASGTRLTARKLGRVGCYPKRLAWSAARLTARLFLAVPCTARGSAKIRHVSVRKAVQSVFDVTVERSGSYQANGLYVSNSDAFGEYAINCGIYPPAEPKKQKPIETRMPTLNEIVKQHTDKRKFVGNRI